MVVYMRTEAGLDVPLSRIPSGMAQHNDETGVADTDHTVVVFLRRFGEESGGLFRVSPTEQGNVFKRITFLVSIEDGAEQ